MGKVISDATVDELRAEIARREAEAKTAQAVQAAAKYAASTSPVGLWRVSTEGDVEGRTNRDLGLWDGHVADIAALLADKAMYGLRFDHAEVTLPAGTEPARKAVTVAISVAGVPTSFRNADRSAFMLHWLGSRPPEHVDMRPAPGDLYGAGSVELTPKRASILRGGGVP